MELLARTTTPPSAESRNELAIFRPLLRLERLLHQLADRCRQVLYRVFEQVFGFRTGDLFCFVIEDRDTAIGARGNHAGREVLEQNLVINLGVLDLSEELRVVDRDGELTAEDLERILLDAPINPPRKPRPQQHDPGEMFPGKDAHRHSDLERPHLFLDCFQFRRLPHAVQLIEDESFPMSFQVLDNRVVFTQHQSGSGNFGRRKRVVLDKGVVFREQDKHAVRCNGARDGFRETLEQVLQCRDGLQDGRGFVHRRTKVEPPCAEK